MLKKLLLCLSLLALASPAFGQSIGDKDSDPLNPLRKGMTRSSVTSDPTCRHTIRSGEWCWFMFGLNSQANGGVDIGTTAAYRAGAGGARICLNPDELTAVTSIPDTDLIVYTYLSNDKAGFNAATLTVEDSQRFSGSTVTIGCYDVDPYAIFYIEWHTVAPTADQPFLVVWGLPQRDQ